MHFEVRSRITHPAPVVLETMIDRMEEIAAFLDNVESIRTCEREELDGGRIRIIRRWQGNASTAPAALAPFLSPDLFSWIDSAVWTPADFLVEWKHTATSATIASLYECTGANRFAPDPQSPSEATIVHVTGDLVVRPDSFPGLPSFLGRRLAPQIEQFVIGLITPNMHSLADGLQRYLDGTSR